MPKIRTTLLWVLIDVASGKAAKFYFATNSKVFCTCKKAPFTLLIAGLGILLFFGFCCLFAFLVAVSGALPP